MSTPDAALLEQLRLLFDAELAEQSAQMVDCLIRLEAGSQSEKRQDLLDQLFRAAHNLKGAARGVDETRIEGIAHALENVFSSLRRQSGPPGGELIDLCLNGVDALTACRQGQLSTHLEALLLEKLGRWEQLQEDVSADEAVGGPEAVARADTAGGHEQPPRELSEDEALIRLAQGKLKRLSALIEELQAVRIEMDDHCRAIAAMTELAQRAGRRIREVTGGQDAGLGLELAKTAQGLARQMREGGNRLGVVCGRLEDQVRQMRLVPVGSLLLPLSRSVRDIAHALGKQVTYEVIGDDFELDRPVLEGIKDSLVHLLRNAIDHGIESAEERAHAGKPASGHVSISVEGDGSRVMIEVRDDGRGMTPGDIAAAAVRKGLISAEKAAGLSPDDALALIFRPGFSSKSIITSISGRGVGLDVVLTSLRALKGDVTVRSKPGHGTTFRMSLPLTLSAEHGLQVRSGGVDYVIPTISVAQLLEVREENIATVGGWPTILVNESPVPFKPLWEVLGTARPEASPGKIAVVLEKGVRRAALLVDDVIGEREIVVKRFRSPLVSVRNVIGGTLTGSGDILVVLNPSDLVATALRAPSRTRLVSGSRVARARILVADDSITTRSLETSILTSHGYTVVQAMNGREAWERIQADPPDAVFTDVEMPEMNGFELTSKIKTHPVLQRIPVVIISSLSAEEHLMRGVEVGANAYIVKRDFETGNVLSILSSLLDSSHKPMEEKIK